MVNYYIGVDIGGTKIAAALISYQGKILTRTKTSTPKKVKPKDIYNLILDSIDELIQAGNITARSIKGIGLGVPGIIDTNNGEILAAPNINLTGFPLARNLKNRYKVPVAITNDVNAGLLGEAWLGAAKGFNHVVGIFPGTGVGGAVIDKGKILLGAQGAATELGHMIIDIDGPKCHCGNSGCLEAVASRWAIERDIRELIKAGRKSKVSELTQGKLTTIKSRILKESLQAHDVVVTQVVRKVSLILGRASVSINHIFNPQAIVFGGGVIKACGFFMLPIIDDVVHKDPFYKSFNKCKILQSKLGDDAVVLGAVKLVLST